MHTFKSNSFADATSENYQYETNFQYKVQGVLTSIDLDREVLAWTMLRRELSKINNTRNIKSRIYTTTSKYSELREMKFNENTDAVSEMIN